MQVLIAECLLLFPQQPDPPIKRPVRLPKQCAEGWRIHVIVHGRSVGAVGHILNSYPCCPAIAMKCELLFDRRIQGEEMRQAKYTRRVDDLAEVVHRRKRETSAIKQRVGKIKLFELPECRQRR